MGNAVDKLVGELKWRVRSVLRAQRFYSTVGMMQLYKSKVLSYAEYRTSAIFHCCPSTLKRVDHVQDRISEEIGVEEFIALIVFNVGPLQLRRGIAMLGVIHRATLGQGPQQYMKLFYREAKHDAKRPRSERYDEQIHDYRDGHQLEIVTQSAIGMASVYSMLPPEIMEKHSLNHFQTALQGYAKDCDHRAVHQ